MQWDLVPMCFYVAVVTQCFFFFHNKCQWLSKKREESVGKVKVIPEFFQQVYCFDRISTEGCVPVSDQSLIHCFPFLLHPTFLSLCESLGAVNGWSRSTGLTGRVMWRLGDGQTGHTCACGWKKERKGWLPSSSPLPISFFPSFPPCPLPLHFKTSTSNTLTSSFFPPHWPFSVFLYHVKVLQL